MKEYINRKAAEQAKPEFFNEKVEDHEKAIYARGWNDCNTQYRENILSIPASDVVEQRYGRWIEFETDAPPRRNRCSECGYITNPWLAYVYNYCPNCGALMDGGVDDAAD